MPNWLVMLIARPINLKRLVNYICTLTEDTVTSRAMSLSISDYIALQWGSSCYKLLMRPNKVETAVQWFRMSHAVFDGFSGHGNSIYNIIPLLWSACFRELLISQLGNNSVFQLKNIQACLSQKSRFLARPLKKTSATCYLQNILTLWWVIEQKGRNFTSFFHFQKRTLQSSPTTIAAANPPFWPIRFQQEQPCSFLPCVYV